MREKYIAVQYNERTSRDLRNWAQMHGFQLDVGFSGEPQQPSDFDFHTTVFFSNSKHIMANGTWSVIPSAARPIGFELLGPNKDVPVLRVESRTLNWLRNYYEKKEKMTDEWPDYKAHISLSYKRNPNYQAPPMPDFPLVYDRLVIKDAIRKEA